MNNYISKTKLRKDGRCSGDIMNVSLNSVECNLRCNLNTNYTCTESAFLKTFHQYCLSPTHQQYWKLSKLYIILSEGLSVKMLTIKRHIFLKIWFRLQRFAGKILPKYVVTKCVLVNEIFSLNFLAPFAHSNDGTSI